MTSATDSGAAEDAGETATARKALWIASYPKSGNRWMLSVLRSAGAQYGFPRSVLGVYQLANAGTLPEACPAVAERFTTDGPCAVVKTHSVYVPGAVLHRIADVDMATAGFVYIYRNPLDVLLSYINFTRIEYDGFAGTPAYQNGLFRELLGFDAPVELEQWKQMTLDSIPRANLDHALRVFSESGLTIPTLAGMSGSWSENVRSWLQAGQTVPNVTLRYEDCLESADHLVALKKLFRFSVTDVRAAARGVDRRARRGSEGSDGYQSIIYNKMKSYYFVDYFSRDAIDRFLADNAATLAEFGYGDLGSRQ